MKYTLRFEEPLAAHPELAGGKGANLALLTQRGFAVPPGFIVTAPVYREFIARVADWGRQVEDLPLGEPAVLPAACAGLRARLLRQPLPAAAETEVRAQLAAFPPGTAFSVRSSSTLEDLAAAAFAGQHETFLNIIGAEPVLDRLRACFASLWTDRAVAYRHQRGFDQAQAAMAVVVQQLVPSESAGVGFSINPISGRLDEMVVNANFGLGESVVSGEGEVDQWILDKPTGAVHAAQIARKTRRVVPVAIGTSEIPVDEGETERPCLAPAQLAALAQLLVRVEASYAFPQDIEWAWAGDTLWLLQSRPVTTLPPRWTRDESAERFPNAITPLTWDFVEAGFHRSLEHSFRLLGFPPMAGKWFALFGHYVYGNQNAVELYARRAPFTVRSLDELRAAIPRLRSDYAWVQELPVAWLRDLDHYLVTLGRLAAEPLEAKTPGELWRHVLEVNEHGAQYFLPNIAISIAQGTLYRLLHGLLSLALAPAEATILFDHLMAWCETKTGQINKELFALAALARSTPGLAAELQTAPSRSLLQHDALARFPEFHARLQRFLRDHGHREVDFDAYMPTWGEAPDVVLDHVRLILQGSADRSPARKEHELRVRAQAAEVRLFSQLPADLHFLFAELLRLTRAYTSLDDLEHYQTTRLTPVLRRGLRALGERLCQRGVLTEPMEVFFAHQDQLTAAISADSATAWQALGAAVRVQKAAYLADRARKPEWVLAAAPAPLSVAGAAPADELRGLAGSPGCAEGPVHLVLSPADFATFPKGSVLVARTTNPTWTPLFYTAVAIITESGGPLSHGAVTAREMGLPAVMSVRESLSRLRNGQRVRVDGTAGRVQLLA